MGCWGKIRLPKRPGTVSLMQLPPMPVEHFIWVLHKDCLKTNVLVNWLLKVTTCVLSLLNRKFGAGPNLQIAWCSKMDELCEFRTLNLWTACCDQRNLWPVVILWVEVDPPWGYADDDAMHDGSAPVYNRGVQNVFMHRNVTTVIWHWFVFCKAIIQYIL